MHLTLLSWKYLSGRANELVVRKVERELHWHAWCRGNGRWLASGRKRGLIQKKVQDDSREVFVWVTCLNFQILRYCTVSKMSKISVRGPFQFKALERNCSWHLHVARASIDICWADDFANGARDLILGNDLWAGEADITSNAANGDAWQFHVILGAHFTVQEFLKGWFLVVENIIWWWK